MVCCDNENCIFKPCLSRCIIDELAKGIIRIFNASFSGLFIGRNVYVPVGISERPVVTDCHDMSEEWFAFCSIGIECLYGLVEYVFITYAPYCLESCFIRLKVLLVDYLIMIAFKECFHIVEVTVSTIKKLNCVSFLH